MGREGRGWMEMYLRLLPARTRTGRKSEPDPEMPLNAALRSRGEGCLLPRSPPVESRAFLHSENGFPVSSFSCFISCGVAIL